MVILLTQFSVNLAWAAAVPSSGMQCQALGCIRSSGTSLNVYPTTTEWTLCYEADQIYIYERWIKIAEGHEYRERKGEMYVNCSLEKAVNTLNDYEHLNTWNKNVRENKLIKKSSSSSYTLYTLFDLPWPFQNRDVISEYSVKQVNPGRHVEIAISSNDNLLKQKPGISRITKYNASWVVKRIHDLKCWVCFNAACDNPPAAPRSIQDPIMRKTFHKNLLNLRKVLE